MIVTASEVRQRLFLQDLAEIDANLEPVIVGAQAQIEALWGSKFAKGTSTDTYSVTNLSYGGNIRLRLRYGLVRSTPVPTVKLTASRGLPLSDLTDMDTSEYVILYELGHVIIPEVYEDYTVVVGYDYGMEDGEEAPAWLKEAVTLQSMIGVMTQNLKPEAPNFRDAIRPLQAQLGQLLDTNVRRTPLAQAPLYGSP